MDVQVMSVEQFCHNSITTLDDHVDLMLAELTLPDTQVAILNRAKTKLECANRLIERHMYPQSLTLEVSAVFDLAEVVDFLGLHEVADKVRATYTEIGEL
ncbi:hypothetical protein LCGC14_1590720 [marine sediment metagenome]|uniref:Uncharacterized protein n=1 Tax=marine sediment metagenome TaxID=412755 RepID=A0A0F9KUR7_9ZZZZ